MRHQEVPEEEGRSAETQVRSNGESANASIAKRRGLFGLLNQPLPVTLLGGVLVLMISTFVQDRYWMSQQTFLANQTLTRHRLDIAISTQEEVAKAVGKIISAGALIIGSHENQLGKLQHNAVLDTNNLLQNEWDQNEELLKLHIQMYFQSSGIQSSWLDVRERLGALDDEITELEKFSTGDPSDRHAKQITQSRKAVEDAEDSLGKLLRLMVEHIEALAHPR
jgi:hypothetical protein